jgi:transcriptional regulator with XRE-family HTH domain
MSKLSYEEYSKLSNKEFGEYLRKLRKEAGYRFVTKLSPVVGCSRQYISMCENGHMRLSYTLYLRIYDICKSSLEQSEQDIKDSQSSSKTIETQANIINELVKMFSPNSILKPGQSLVVIELPSESTDLVKLKKTVDNLQSILGEKYKVLATAHGVNLYLSKSLNEGYLVELKDVDKLMNKIESDLSNMKDHLKSL